MRSFSKQASCSETLTFDVESGQIGGGGGGGYSFSQRKDAGAILCMEAPALRVDFAKLIPIMNYALTHYASWLKFARDVGYDVRLRDLRFVTGCDKTSGWGCAAWSDCSRSKSRNIAINFRTPAVQLDGSASVWGTWETRDSVYHNVGPERPSLPSVKDQCVFVRGYIVAERLVLKPKVKIRAGEAFDILEKPIFSLPKPQESSTSTSGAASQESSSPAFSNAAAPDEQSLARASANVCESDSDEADTEVCIQLALNVLSKLTAASSPSKSSVR